MKESTSVDLRDFFSLMWRRKGTMAAIVAVVLGAALLLSSQQTPIYESKASILVEAPPANGGAPTAPNMATEKLVASSPAVASRVASTLHLSEPLSQLLQNLSVSVPVETEILDFSYADQRPKVAQQLAQAFAQAYLEFRKQKLVQDTRASRDALDVQIRALNKSLDEVNKKAAAASSSAQQDVMRSQAAALNSQIFILQERLAQLTMNQDVSAGSLIEDASLPGRPSHPDYVMNGFLGVVLGLTLGFGVVVVRAYLGDRIEGAKDLESQTGAPVLGTIPTVRARGPASARLVTVHRPTSNATEAFRHLRANLVVAATSCNAKTILITSAQSHEGKTFTAANLGVVLAKAGSEVILLSADLRRPELEQLFGISAAHGFAAALTSDSGMSPELVAAAMWSVETNLTVLPVGRAPENPAELLGSSNMAALIKELRDLAEFVLIDAAALLPVADASIVAPACDAALIVADANSSRRRHLVQAREQLERIHVPVLGAVLVNTSPHGLKPYQRS